MLEEDLSGAEVTRRHLLGYVSAVCAGLLSESAFAGVDTYSRKVLVKNTQNKGELLSATQLFSLQHMVQVIIPATDTPGAADADTHGFIDHQLKHCRSPKDASVFISNLDRFNELVEKQWQQPYPQLPESKKNEAMAALAVGSAPFTPKDRSFFQALKALTLFGYYSSKEGSTLEHIYLPLPGGFTGDHPLKLNKGRAFSYNR